MANETITDQTATTAVASTDVFELEQSGPATKKITGTNLAKGLQPLAFSGARVYKSAPQTTADYTTAANITFDSEHFDTDGYHSTVSNTDRLTVPAAGYYEVTFSIFLGSVTADLWVFAATNRFNSSNVAQASNTGTARQRSEVGTTTPNLTGNTGPVLCSAGDYFVLALQVETDTSITVDSTATSFAIRRVG